MVRVGRLHTVSPVCDVVVRMTKHAGIRIGRVTRRTCTCAGKRADDLSMTVDLNTVPKGQRGKICDKDWSKALESGIIKKRRALGWDGDDKGSPCTTCTSSHTTHTLSLT